MRTFTNVASMKLATLNASQFVETGGYYEKGGSGAAKYFIKPAQAADGLGDHILANGNVAVLMVDGVIDVTQFGAKGDGVADDTLALQASFNQIDASVYVPEGTYIVSAALVMGNGYARKVSGAGMYTSQIRNETDHTVPIISVNGDSFGWTIRDLLVSHSGKGSGGDGIKVNTINRSYALYNVHAAVCDKGFNFDGVQYVMSLYGCRATSCTTGFYSNDPSGTSTTFSLYSCYATDFTVGFDFKLVKTLTLVQPIVDINNANASRAIRLSAVAVSNIIGAHIEGFSAISGFAIEIVGSATDTVNIDGMHMAVAATAGSEWYVLHAVYAGDANIKLDGIDGTQATNTLLYGVRNNAADITKFVFGDNNKFGGIDASASGRKRISVAGAIEVSNPVRHGFASQVSSSNYIPCGLPTAPDTVQVTVKPAAGTYHTVSAAVDSLSSSGGFYVRFANLSDGSPNTVGKFDIYWSAALVQK